MKRTAWTLAGLSLTQCLVMASVTGLPLAAFAQSRPNFAEIMAPVPGRKSYGQDLVERIASRHPDLLELDLHAVPPGSDRSVIIAAKSESRVGKASDSDDITVARTGNPRVEINQAGNNNVEVAVPLQDVAGRPIGTVEMTFPYVSGTDQDALVQKGTAIADELRRRIAYGAEDLVAPAQYDPRVPIDNYAQFLVDDLLARQPAVLIAVLHVKETKGEGFPIVASNIGRIGKAADESDLEVVRSGQIHAALNASGSRLEVKMPARDSAGNVVAVLAIVFPSRIASRDALVSQAESIRDDLRARVTSLAQLYGPYPATQPTRVVQTEYDKQ